MSVIKNLFPATRCFIAGIEVTGLVSSVQRNWPTNSPQQVTIELANLQSVFTMTKDDMLTLGGVKDNTLRTFLDSWVSFTAGLLSEEQLQLIRNVSGVPENQFAVLPSDFVRYAAKMNREGPTKFAMPQPIPPMTLEIAQCKNRIVSEKLEAVYMQPTVGVDGKPIFEELFYRYPFYQGKSIFHFGDPVRIAMRDPRKPSRWHWFHSGTVTDIGTKKTEDHLRTITITSEGVLKDLRNARVAQMTGAFRSPGIVQGPPTSAGSPSGGYEIFPVKDQAPAGTKPSPFTDEQVSILTSAVPFSNFLQGLTINQILELLVFGVQSVLDNFSQEVRRNTAGLDTGALAVIAERIGISIDKQSGKITDQNIKAREAQLRGLNLAGLAKFKRWKKTQGVEIHILGGPIDEGDRQIGQYLTNGLATWQAILEHEIRPSDLLTMKVQVADSSGPVAETAGRPYSQDVADAAQVVIGPLRELFLGLFGPPRPEELPPPPTVPNVSVHDVITRIGTNPADYPIRQRVLMLLPANLGSALGRRVLDLDLAGCPATTSEYFDRLSLIQQVLTRLDFVIMDSPRGDIVVEMPLYDFEPRHFTEEGAASLVDIDDRARPSFVSALAFLRNAPAALTHVFKDSRRSYESDFTILAEDAGAFDMQATEQDVKTVWVSVPRYTNAVARDGSNSGNRQVVSILPNLVPLFGFRVEQGDPPGNIVSETAARVFNHIKLNQANADTINVRMAGMLPNHRLWPNRPVLIDEEAVVGTVKSVTDNFSWQSDCSTTINLSYTKLWDGRFVYKTEFTPPGGTTDPRLSLRLQGQTNGLVRLRLFTPFGGVNARPYNYAYLLRIESQAKDARAALSKNNPAGQGQGDAVNNILSSLQGKPLCAI